MARYFSGRAVAGIVLALLTAPAGVVELPAAEDEGSTSPNPASLTHGPFVGHVTPSSGQIWGRCPAEGTYLAKLVDTESGREYAATAVARADDDLCVVWKFAGLEPGHVYQYTIERNGTILCGGAEYQLRTPLPEHGRCAVTLAFASCAGEDEGTATVWRRWSEINPDVVVMLGDTPYIDSTDLAVQRRRYREFAAVTPMQTLLRRTSWYGTWDDHDFGRNDIDGRLPGKEHSRQAFIEYHANPDYGTGSEGIYTSFRRGGVEVFLLDTRYFAATEDTAQGSGKPSLLGRAQWEWLKQRLVASDAPFKVLACGMIYNAATRPNKPDHWMSYPHEREALFHFLGTEKIPGVILVSGDIHRSRALKYPTKETVGYDLVELITSPMHDSIIEEANAPHPALLFDAGEPHSFLLLTADTTVDPPTLTGQLQNAAGRSLFEIRVTAADLTATRSGS